MLNLVLHAQYLLLDHNYIVDELHIGAQFKLLNFIISLTLQHSTPISMASRHMSNSGEHLNTGKSKQGAPQGCVLSPFFQLLHGSSFTPPLGIEIACNLY